jgi:LAO/AO transport system kinase
MTDWLTQIRAGNKRALARLLTLIENDHSDAEAALTALYPHTGNAHIVGVTGAPGTGKSTLVTALAQGYREQNKTVAVLAVDPTSPFSGGALLGDRVRMAALSGDKGVFIRSMATRGSLGGLAWAARDAVRVLDAAGFDVVLVETVGAGQSEVDIVRTANTTIVVEAPGLGDGVQAIKAGILEIADILVVNKADHPGAANTVRALRAMLEIGHPTKSAYRGHHGAAPTDTSTEPEVADAFWQPPIIETIATEKVGIDTLIQQIHTHYQHILRYNVVAVVARQAAEAELLDRLQAALLTECLAQVGPERLSVLVSRVAAREISTRKAVQDALDTRDRNRNPL